jgi:pyruvate dehydrogenase E1 component alpha subunit/2-oxoisovalerate dehydrogenase E1 component alpha subunit
LTRAQLLELYYFVRLTRDIEERLLILYRQSKVVGGLYRSLGQEGESVASAYALDRGDAVAALTRNLGSLVTRGVRPRDILAQYMGRGTSPSRGRDGNLHMSNIPPFVDNARDEPIIVGTISPLGDLIPVMAGMALGARLHGRAMVAMTFIGDGGTSTGAFHEGMNFSAVQHLPLVVIAEDNKFAYSTPIAKQMAIACIDERAAAYGMRHELVDGDDVLAVYDAAKRAVDRARAGEGPSLVGVNTMRMVGHAQHDDMRYVPPLLLQEWARRDPLDRYRKWLVGARVAVESELADLERTVAEYVDDELRIAEAEPLPDPAEVGRGVYAETAFMLPRLEIVRSPFAE